MAGNTQELLDLALKAGMVGDPQITQLIEAYQITGEKYLYEAAKELLSVRAAPVISSGDQFYPYPPSQDIEGPVVIGQLVPTGEPVGLFPEELNRGMLVAAAPGVGKTNLLELLAPQVVRLGIKVCLIDVKKDFLGLFNAIPDLAVLDLQTLRFNPLAVPPGANPNLHAQLIASIYRKALGVVVAGESTFFDAVHELYQDYGVFGGKRTFPCLLDLLEHERIAKNKPFSPKTSARDREVMRLNFICKALGEAVVCSEGFSIEDLLASNLLLLVDSLNPDIRSFLVGSLLTSMIEFRMAKEQRGMGLLNWVCIDEGKNLFSINEEKRVSQGIPTFTEFFLASRDFGFGSCVTDHMPTVLGSGIKAGSYAKLLMPLGDAKDIWDMAQSMGLSHQQLQQSFHLGPNQAILKLTGRWTWPVRVEISASGVERSVTLQDAKQRCQGAVDRLLSKVQPRIPWEPTSAPAQDDLPSEEEVFVKHVCQYPFMPLKERYKSVKLPKRTTFRVRERLEKEGYLQAVFVQPGRGRPTALLELTDKGKQFAGQKSIKLPKFRSGLRHAFWVEQARLFFEAQGLQTEKEAPLKGPSGDVFPDLLLLGNQGRRMAVEVELSDHGLRNILKLLPVVDFIYVVTEDDQLGERLKLEARQTLLREEFNRLDFYAARDLGVASKRKGKPKARKPD